MTNDLYSEIKSEIKNRSRWEEKQGVWYQMRFDGIKRARKPYPNAPDMHYPLTDTMVEKLKPFYISQVYDKERLATFLSESPDQDQGQTSLDERLFDFTVRQRTNFERAIYTSIDNMLMYGRGPMKVYWDEAKKKIIFSPVRPIHLIVPSWTEDSSDADWLVHVLHLSKAQYLRNKSFLQDNTFVKSIIGRGIGETGLAEFQRQNILKREGITCGQNDHQIVLWEVYWRDIDGTIRVDLISPMAGWDRPVRPTSGIPYKHGQMPFVDLRYEIADPDYYSPRGIVEILSHNELDLCKMWNHKLQWLDFHGQPQYQNTGGIANPNNFKNEPGRILPQGVTPVNPGSAPLDFKEEMELQRALAEDRIQVPDLNSGQHLAGDRGSSGKITARQVSAIMQLNSGGNDMRGRIFKMQLATLYKQTQSLIDQYLPDDQRVLDDFTQVPQSSGNYRVEPSGNADSATKEQRVAKGLAYYQTLQGNPAVPVAELTKWLLEQDSADLVKRLWRDPGLTQMKEGEKQALEFLLMESGFPAQVDPSDDDKAHIQAGMQWMERKRMSNEPITSETALLALQHFGPQGHAGQVMKKRDKEGMAMLKQMQPYAQVLEQIVQQHATGAPGGVIDDSGMPAAQAPGAPQGPAPAGAAGGAEVKESIQINYKDAPPSIRRQIEAKAGFHPATAEESKVEHMTNLKNAQPKPAPQPSAAKAA